jgi:hypothetical protein
VIFNLLDNAASSDCVDFDVALLLDVRWAPSIFTSSFFFQGGPTFGQQLFFTYLQFRQVVHPATVQQMTWSHLQLVHCVELTNGTLLLRSVFFVCNLHNNSSWVSDRPFVGNVVWVKEVVNLSGTACRWAGSLSLSCMIHRLALWGF